MRVRVFPGARVETIRGPLVEELLGDPDARPYGGKYLEHTLRCGECGTHYDSPEAARRCEGVDGDESVR